MAQIKQYITENVDVTRVAFKALLRSSCTWSEEVISTINRILGELDEVEENIELSLSEANSLLENRGTGLIAYWCYDLKQIRIKKLK